VRRSNVLVFAGIACFVIGVVIVALLSRDNGGGGGAASGTTVDVLFAKEDIAAGTTGEDALAKVEVKRIDASQRQPDALSTQSQLGNQLFTIKFSKGEQIRTGGLKVRSISNVPVEAGKEAVAVQVPFVAGGAGYLAPGDVVNVYEVIPDAVQTVAGSQGTELPYSTPRSQLLLTQVKVLDVQQQIPALTQGTPTTDQTGVVTRPTGTVTNLTVLLSIDAIDAEKVIFGSSSKGVFLYLSRVGDKDQPSGPTPGRDYFNIFEESPQAAKAHDK
jgi:Flp pilus assembly protein CpaB